MDEIPDNRTQMPNDTNKATMTKSLFAKHLNSVTLTTTCNDNPKTSSPRPQQWRVQNYATQIE